MELTEHRKANRRTSALPQDQQVSLPVCSRLFAPARQFNPDEPELIDRPGTDPAWLRLELQVMARANARDGVHHLLFEYVDKFSSAISDRPVEILDLGTGAADIPRALAARFREKGRSVKITAGDRNPEALRAARETCREWPEIRVEQNDLLALPYNAGSFDLVLCSQALHHFTNSDAVRLLGGMWEICRVGCLVNDLRRNWASIGIVELVSRTLIRSPILRHDAPQSCRAAFTVDELRALAEKAGMQSISVNRHHGPFRMVLEARK